MFTGPLYESVTTRQFNINNYERITYLQKEILETILALPIVNNEIVKEIVIKLLSIFFKENNSGISSKFDILKLFEKLDLDENKKKNLIGLVDEYIKLNDSLEITDDLANLLEEYNGDTFYYIGINHFVTNYYKNNPNSEWKIKAILQIGFPFEVINKENLPKMNILQNYIKNKKWSIFIFTKQKVPFITIGFDDRNTFSRMTFENERHDFEVKCALEELPKDYKGNLFLVWDARNEDLDYLIQDYLNDKKIPVFTNADYNDLKYSFERIPSEFFRIEYLDFLSRYKKSVVDIFGYPEENEIITKLKNVVEFINAPGKESIYPSFEKRKTHVLIKDLFFKDGDLIPTVRIGEQNIDNYNFFEEYEIQSYIKTISPYYLYCLLSSELISDYYKDRYDSNDYYDSRTPVPLEDCIFFELSTEKMCDKKFQEKYERDINSRLKAHELITSKSFSSDEAKKSVEKYLAEIKNDIDAGSYYSATILMGSVLEAFLIDWLSEIDGKDYFHEDYMIVDKKYHHERRADLKDYIDEIQKKRPDWIAGAKKATEIRKKRNLVHAKLYIAEGEISQDICYEMLQNLEAIINNRWNK